MADTAEPTTQPPIDLSFGLGGKVALITGGASGIGAAVAGVFVAKGASVAVVDLDRAAADATAARLGDPCGGFTCDVSDPASVKAAVEAVLEEYGQIDVLVNCAGIALLAPAEDLTAEAFDKTMAVNVRGTFLVCQEVGRHMLVAGKGKIVNLASQAATVALNEHVAYCASKFAVVGMTKCSPPNGQDAASPSTPFLRPLFLPTSVARRGPGQRAAHTRHRSRRADSPCQMRSLPQSCSSARTHPT